MSAPRSREWWRGCVIYQIYPRSFADSNGDGIGDLPGITGKLQYVASLGVDAVWISPFFASPMKDFGYDVSDYRAVAPEFGTLADFDRLLERAHELGLAVMLDQVLSHTSDQHPWFAESRASRHADKADWYVWADPEPDGSPPNNWMSVFGGSAWQWEPRRRQYYLHNFLSSQPDLNFHNPAVVDALLADIEFWLKRGVDGFRFDAVNFCTHDPELRDNPAKPGPIGEGAVLSVVYPYSYQQHIYDKTRPENLAFLRRVRALLDRYPGTASLGEVSGDNDREIMAAYTAGGDVLHMAYAFDLLVQRFSSGYIHDVIAELEATIGDGWPCWSMSNHDVTRVISRWGAQIAGEGVSDAAQGQVAKLLMALLCSLRGSVCIYQGEELGLSEVEIPYEKVRDPFGLALWPELKGRDGCRTAMPWQADGPYAGFSTAEPWLAVPIPDQHRRHAVAEEQAHPDSILNACRRFLAWRRDQPALRLGSIELLDAPEGMLAFVRVWGDRSILAAFNFTPAPLALTTLPSAGTLESLSGHGFGIAEASAGKVELPAFGAYFARLAGS